MSMEMVMKPVIAIPELGPGLLRQYLGSQYVIALWASGAKVRWIKRNDPKAVLECDGLLVPGGDDVDPSLYGAERSEKCGKPNPTRDELDPVVLKLFLQTGKPILGVCRGLQMTNAFFGGTLHQDIKDIQKINHGGPMRLKKLQHHVTVTEGSLLHRIVGDTTIPVNTFHHQAAQDVAPSLAVSAMSPDGIVEALEMPGHGFLLGVQWHPEHLMHNIYHKKIITAFVKACKK